MRLIFMLLLSLGTSLVYADYPTPPSNFPQPGMLGTSPGSSQSNPSGSDVFGAMVQQYTNQAMQTFQNVTYSKLSGNEDQNSFFSDDSSDSNPPDPSHLFNLFPGS